MRKCLLRRHVGELVAGAATERAAACSEHQPSYLPRRTGAQALRQRRVLRVDRHDLARSRALGHQRPAGDQRLLVGQREHVSGVECSESWGETDRTGHPVDDDVGARPGRHLGGGVRPGEQLRQPELAAVVTAALRLGVERELDVLGG